MTMLAERPPDGKYGSSLSIDTWCSSTYCQMVKMLSIVNLYQIIYIGGRDKIVQNRTIVQYLPYVTQWDYLVIMFTEAITVNAPKRSIGKYVSRRASYIRVIMLELGRLASHFLQPGLFMADIGAQTISSYILNKLPSLLFLERDMIYDLFLLQVYE